MVRSGYWPWISLGLAIGWIGTVLLLFNQSRRRRTPPANPVRAIPIMPLERAVEKACLSADAAATKQALLAWAAVRWPEHSMTSLADIARASPTALSTEINVLNRTLYSVGAGDWDPRALLAAFHAFIPGKRSKIKPHDSILEPLYKT